MKLCDAYAYVKWYHSKAYQSKIGSSPPKSLLAHDDNMFEIENFQCYWNRSISSISHFPLQYESRGLTV